MTPMSEVHPSRRWFLGAGVAALAWAAAGCSDGGSDGAGSAAGGAAPTSTSGPAGTGGTAASGALRPADFDALGTCVLIPAMAAGPFPNRERL